MIPMFLKTSKPAAGTVLSVLVEKMCSEMKRLGSVDTFDESTGPVLANLLNAPGVCDLLSAVRECPLRAFLGRSSWSVSELDRKSRSFQRDLPILLATQNERGKKIIFHARKWCFIPGMLISLSRRNAASLRTR